MLLSTLSIGRCHIEFYEGQQVVMEAPSREEIDFALAQSLPDYPDYRIKKKGMPKEISGTVQNSKSKLKQFGVLVPKEE